jgi:DNA-binding transcriptional ArsR family regulator
MAGERVEEGGQGDPLAQLSGTALKAYLTLLKAKRPLGVRELQRRLGLRSPSTARHHLERLVQLGLAERRGDGYVAVPPKHGLLKVYMVIYRRLIPRSLILTAFLAASTAAYTLAPGSDPAAAAILAVATALSAYETALQLKAARELEKL